jgi:hypothetical protein
LATAAKLKAYVQLLARSDAAIEADNSTELAEINNDEGSGAGDYSAQTDSIESLRDRGDAAWVTGGGGSISDILTIEPLIPYEVDLANTALYRLGIMLVNSLDDLPSMAEISPGTISIDRKAIGGTSWSAVITDVACSEYAGMVFYDVPFNSGAGYAEGDSLRITFKSVKITVAANDYEVIDSNGRMFYTSIRQTMRGTDNALLAANVPTNFSALGIESDGDLTKVNALDGHTPQTADNDTKLSTILTRLVGTILAGNHTAQSADNNTHLSTLISRIIGTLASGTHVAQTGDSFARIGAAGAGLTGLGGMSSGMKAEVNAEVEDVINTDASSEPGQATPSANASLGTKISYLYKAWRNKKTQTATDHKLYNDDGSTVGQKSTVSDDGTTATAGEMTTGP